MSQQTQFAKFQYKWMFVFCLLFVNRQIDAKSTTLHWLKYVNVVLCCQLAEFSYCCFLGIHDDTMAQNLIMFQCNSSFIILRCDVPCWRIVRCLAPMLILNERRSCCLLSRQIKWTNLNSINLTVVIITIECRGSRQVIAEFRYVMIRCGRMCTRKPSAPLR